MLVAAGWLAWERSALRLQVLLDEPLAERAVEPVLQLRMSSAPELQRVPEALPLQAERESEWAQVGLDPRQTAVQQAQEARGVGPAGLAAQLPVLEEPEPVRRLQEPQEPRERRVQPAAPQQARRSAGQLRVAAQRLLRAANGPLWQPLPWLSFPAQPWQLPLLRPPPDHGSACGLSPRPIHRSSWSGSSFR